MFESERYKTRTSFKYLIAQTKNTDLKILFNVKHESSNFRKILYKLSKYKFY